VPEILERYERRLGTLQEGHEGSLTEVGGRLSWGRYSPSLSSLSPYGRSSAGVPSTRPTESSCQFEPTTVLSGMGAPSSRRLVNVSSRCDQVSSDGGFEPQPISWGSISQGIPLFSTNTMPVRAARSSMRGLPPRGFGGSGGRSGSMVSHSSSVTSSLAMFSGYPINGFVRLT
jgi:hypothetical protein